MYFGPNNKVKCEDCGYVHEAQESFNEWFQCTALFTCPNCRTDFMKTYIADGILPTTFDVYADPGHAWMKVHRYVIVTLNILDKITGYSFVRDEWLYLEEDCDMTTFYYAYLLATGEKPQYRNHHTNRSSRIRSYARWSPLVDSEWVSPVDYK